MPKAIAERGEKMKAVTVKLPPDIVEEAKAAADGNDESFARLVRRALRSELDRLSDRRRSRA